MDLAAVIAAMPNAEPLAGLPDAWHWAKVPGFDVAAALSSDGTHLFQLYAHDCYDEDLVTAVLAFARQHEAELIAPPARPLALAEGFAHPGRGFDMVVDVGPGIHKYHAEDGPVHEVTRAVFPAYRCEFSGTENEKDVDYRYSRAAGVAPTSLDREPRPTLKIRYQPESGRIMKRPVYFVPSSLRSELAHLENRPDLFVEFENYQNRLWRVEWDGTWNIAELTGDPGERRELGHEELLEFAKTVLYGPNLDAGTSEFTKTY
jgi:hypothetical protein